MAKVVSALILAFLGTIVAAKLAFEATTAAQRGPVSEQPWTQNKMEFVAWNGVRWTAWIVDDRFELVPQNTGRWSRHSNATLAFVDWQGEPWQAKIAGDKFMLAHRGAWAAGSKHADAIRYRDWSGREQLRTVTQLRR